MSTRPAGIGFILVTLFLDVLGIGLVIPILPRLLAQFVGDDVERSSHYFGLFVALYALMQFVFSPIMGSLSDRFGRRAVLLLSLLGSGLDYVLLAFAPSLAWLFVGRVIAGITGASIGAASAYIADVSPPEKRAQNFGLIGLMFGLGFIAGPALGGLLGGANLRLPFFAAAALTLVNALWGFFVLPESLAPENRRPFSWKAANPLGALVGLARHPAVLGLVGSLFFVVIAQRGLESTWVLYTEHRYGWDVAATGLSLAVVGLGAAVVQGGLVRKIIPLLGERRALVFGLGISVVAFALYGLAPQGWMLYAILPLGSLGGIAGPALQGLLSRAVPANEQGLLQGGLGSLQGIASIVAPPAMTSLFGFFSGPRAPLPLPGISFLVGSVMMLVGLLLAMRTFARQPEATAASEPAAG